MAGFVSAIASEVRRMEAAGRVDEARMKRIDWLAVAIGNLGGPGPATRVLGLSRQTVYTWLNEGLGKTAFEHVVALSNAADVPLEYLARRLGPWAEALEVPRQEDG
jgi:hypothetical protein